MTDEPIPATEGDEAGEAATPKTGRPRPDATKERDALALEKLTAAGPEGMTREQLAQALDITPSAAYLSIYRLSRDYSGEAASIGRTRKDGKTVWMLLEHVPAGTVEPTEAPAEGTPAE